MEIPSPAGTVLHHGNMSLICAGGEPNTTMFATQEWQRADIVTNQIGYFPDCRKQATLISDETDAVDFSLCDESGKEVYTGASKPMGEDPDSGDSVHILDFSEFKEAGTYTLRAGDAASREFAIGGTEVYSGMLFDALNHAYQNRSGIAIESQYITSGDAAALARSAGHSNDTARIHNGRGRSPEQWRSQDVSFRRLATMRRSWKKYVVNGGIALRMMQNQYERAVSPWATSHDSYADDTMQIPEQQERLSGLAGRDRTPGDGVDAQDDPRRTALRIRGHGISQGARHQVDSSRHGTGRRSGRTHPQTAGDMRSPGPCSACAAQAARLWAVLMRGFAGGVSDRGRECLWGCQKHDDLLCALGSVHWRRSLRGRLAQTMNLPGQPAELYLTTGERHT
ncbi:MAG: cellulase N-terminal Ig-like domain-containing protein [Ruminococcus sp.]